jgi:hypothetical protein
MPRFSVLVLLASLTPLIAQDINSAGQPFPEVAMPQAARASGIIGALGQRLPEVAKWYGMPEAEFRALLQRDRSIIADRSGRLAYSCSGLVAPDEIPDAAAPTAAEGIVYPPAQTFFLHSRPGAIRKIYLDFDGHTTSGTIWNNNFNGGSNFATPRYDIDGNTTGFSSTELSRIQEIWKRVAEDFAPYEVDVTTEDPGVEALRRSPSTDSAYGIRVCIGGSSYDWYKRGAGGVAYIGSFNWTSDTPCFVFTEQLGAGNEKYTAEAASHEVGHTLGLNHDGLTDGTEYYRGHGDWAPIMGVGYDKSVVQWSQGEYPLANNLQDDTTVMRSFGAPLRADDVGDTTLNATPLNDTGVAMEGVIHTQSDRDVYSFSTGAGPVSFSTAAPSASPNLDVALTLYDVEGTVVASSDPATLTGSLNATVSAGTYFIAVEGTAPGDPLTSYNDYGSLGGYELTAVTQSTAENFVSVVATDADAEETARFVTPNTGTFVFTRLVVSSQPLVVPFTISGTGVMGTHFSMPTTVTIPARAAKASITVTPIDNASADGSRTATVTLSPSPGYSLANAKQATVTIRDNDLPEVSVLASVTQTLENSATPLKVTIHRDAKAPTPLTVHLLVSGSAEPGVHYGALPSSVTFPPGEDKLELLLQPADNDYFNPTQTVTVTVAPDLEYNPGFNNTVTLKILNEESPPDPIKPSVTISSPKAKQRFPAPVTSLIATGTAKDNLSVARVQVRVNGGDWNLATLNQGTWSAPIENQVVPGNNLLEARAEDDDANASPIMAVTFTVVKPRNLQVAVTGPGTVTPGSGSFEAMQPYALKARPQAGKIFAGWTGDITGSGKLLYFTMPDADLQVTATFVDNPFSEGVIGKYTGLLQGPNPAAPQTSGLLTTVVTRTGAATGKVWLGGKSYPMKGEFNGLGRLDAEIAVKKQPKILVGLNLDMNPSGSQSITGTITGPAGASTVQASRAPYDAKKNPLPTDFARSYTFYLPAHAPVSIPGDASSAPPVGPDTAPKPEGYGVGILSISTGGVVKWTGTLGDGSPTTQTTMLNAQKRWPLYVPLYKANGFIAGDVTHDPAALHTDLSATLNWIKLPTPSDRFFPGGFKMEGHVLLGVNYTAPAKGQRVLPGYDAAIGNTGSLLLEEGNLEDAGLSGSLTLLPTNATQITSTLEKLKLSIKAKSGTISGSFIFPVTHQVTPIKGVILQGKIGKGIGFFPGSTLSNTSLQTGRLEFIPSAP